MIYEGDITCPVCGGSLKLYDHVLRIVRKEKGVKEYVYIRRMQCMECGRVHRELPKSIIPYIQYDKSIVSGVLNGSITPDDLEYEDYPSEMTMSRWHKRSKRS